MHSCEICGTDGLTDDGLQSHTHLNHMKRDGDPVCPFCDLTGVSAQDMAVHVNCVHLDYLTPDREAISIIDDGTKPSNKEVPKTIISMQ